MLAQETAELDMELEMASSDGEPPAALEPTGHAGDAPALGSFDADEIPDEQALASLPPLIPDQGRLTLE